MPSTDHSLHVPLNPALSTPVALPVSAATPNRQPAPGHGRSAAAPPIRVETTVWSLRAIRLAIWACSRSSRPEAAAAGGGGGWSGGGGGGSRIIVLIVSAAAAAVGGSSMPAWLSRRSVESR